MGLLFLGGASLSGLSGCGGDSKLSNNLTQFRPGRQWTYRVQGTAFLPSSLGGGSQNVQTTSTLVMNVDEATVKDANNIDVRVLNRRLTLVLLDGRQIKANFRLYFTQDNLGLFVHGFNNSSGETMTTANDRFVPSTVNPPFKFLYLPNPITPGGGLAYNDQFGAVLTEHDQYTFTVEATPRQVINVPAGEYLAYSAGVNEQFSRFVLTNVAFVPEQGVVAANLTAELPDGTTFSGSILLTSAR